MSIRRPKLRLLIVLAGLGLLAACFDPVAEGYQLVYADEFDGTTLGADWETQSWYLPAPAAGEVEVSNGTLKLNQQQTAPWGTGDGEWVQIMLTGQCDWYTSAPNCPDLDRHVRQEGYFEARMRFTDNPYAWPAFWATAAAPTQQWPDWETNTGCVPANGEWDIFERLGGAFTATMNLHSNTNSPCGIADEGRALNVDTGTVNVTDWHLWGGRWTADQVCLYVDGQELGCLPTFASTAQPMHLLFTMAKKPDEWVTGAGCYGLNPCPPPPPVMTLEVDYLHVYELAPTATTTTTTTTTSSTTTTTVKPCKPRPNRPCPV